MTTKNKKIVIIVSAVAMVIVILTIVIPAICLAYDLFFSTEIKMDGLGWDGKYTERMQSKLSEQKVSTLGEVYDFDWDKAYVIGTDYDDILALILQYGNAIKADGSGFGPGLTPRYIIFIKDNQYLCTHFRTTDDFIITNEQVIVTKQTKLENIRNGEYEFVEGFEYYELEYDDQGERVIRVKDKAE